MADSDRRIVGEGVELGRLFRFPTILRAVSMAFGPPRLVLGLLLVVSLMTAGRLWDGVTDPRVSPEGLWEFSEEEDREALEVVLAEALATYVKDPNEWPDEPREAIAVAELIKTQQQVGRDRNQSEAERPEEQHDHGADHGKGEQQAARLAEGDLVRAQVEAVHAAGHESIEAGEVAGQVLADLIDGASGVARAVQLGSDPHAEAPAIERHEAL